MNRMRLLLGSVVLICVFCFSLSCEAQSSDGDFMESSLLWKVSHPEQNHVSYLFGTYHLLNNSFLESWPKVLDSYKSAEIIVVETVIDSSQIGAALQLSQMSGPGLSERMNTSDYDLVSRVFQKTTGYPLMSFDTYKPIFIGVMMTLFQNMEILNALPQYTGVPLDQYFASSEDSKGKNVVPLETMMEQAELLYNSTTIEEQLNNLLAVIKDSTLAEDVTLEIVDAYMKNDMKCLEFLNEQDFDEWGDMDHLLEARNDRWLKTLPELLDSASVFIAVGALHLPGEDGLINGLKSAGYSVEPIPEN